MARPTKYHKDFPRQLVAFFDVPLTRIVDVERAYKGEVFTVKMLEVSDLPTFEAFGASIDVAVSTMWEWAKKYKEFSKAYKKAQQLQEHLLVGNSITGRYQGSFAMFYLKNKFAYVDRNEVDHTSDGERILASPIIVSDIVARTPAVASAEEQTE
jgi:hypothetical protein